MGMPPDEARVHELLERYADMVLRIAYQNLKSRPDAEDVAQEVFIRFMQKMPRFASDEHEKAWFIWVTINLCKDFLKSGWKKRTVYAQPPEDFCGLPFRVLDTVMELPEADRNVLYLFYYEGYTAKEIAAILRCREGTVTSRLSRARARLKILLEEERTPCATVPNTERT